MNVVPPVSMWLNIVRPDHRAVRLWLPLILLWLILLPLVLLALTITAIVDIALLVVGRPYHHYTLLLLRCAELLADTRGLVVRVNGDDTVVDVTIR